jgi:UDP-2,3-diacylglucosamine pyrophosphatase LpxH
MPAGGRGEASQRAFARGETCAATWRVPFFVMHHTVVVSDVHLCEVEPGTDLWMRYRQRPWLPDAELAAMLGALCDEVRGQELTLVLGGDVFDLDAPRVIGQKSVFHDLPRTPEHAVPALAAILDDHPEVVAALGRVLAEGHRIVVISGNHDVELTLPDVRTLLRARLVCAALTDEGAAARSNREELDARIVFRAWFYLTPDGILVEHGHQYDPYCSYRYPMAPYRRRHRTALPGSKGGIGDEVTPTMGSLATRLLVSRLGYFNPHVDSSFMLSAAGYVAHWARYYLFSRHSLALTWAVGSARILIELLRRRDAGTVEQRRSDRRAAAAETGATLLAVARHARLFADPAEARLGTVVRELWLDRMIVALVCAALAVAWFWFASGRWALGGLVPALFIAAYGRILPKAPLGAAWRNVGLVARRVARIHRAKAVVLGHTHLPEGAWEGGVFYGNTGCWSAAYRDIACTEPVSNERPVVWLTSDGSEIRGGLWAWRGARFEPRVVRDSRRVFERCPRDEPGERDTRGRGNERERKESGEPDVVREVAAGASSDGRSDRREGGAASEMGCLVLARALSHDEDDERRGTYAGHELLDDHGR